MSKERVTSISISFLQLINTAIGILSVQSNDSTKQYSYKTPMANKKTKVVESDSLLMERKLKKTNLASLHGSASIKT